MFEPISRDEAIRRLRERDHASEVGGREAIRTMVGLLRSGQTEAGFDPETRRMAFRDHNGRQLRPGGIFSPPDAWSDEEITRTVGAAVPSGDRRFTRFADMQRYAANLPSDTEIEVTLVTEVVCDVCGPLDPDEPRAYHDSGSLVIPEGAHVMMADDAQDRLARHIEEHHPERWLVPQDGQTRGHRGT